MWSTPVANRRQTKASKKLMQTVECVRHEERAAAYTLVLYDNKISCQDWSRHGNSEEIHIKWLISATHTPRISGWRWRRTLGVGFTCVDFLACAARALPDANGSLGAAFCQQQQQRWRGNNKRAAAANACAHDRGVQRAPRMDFSFGASEEAAVTPYLICMCGIRAARLVSWRGLRIYTLLFSITARCLFDDYGFIYIDEPRGKLSEQAGAMLY